LNLCYGLLERAERAVALLTGVDPDGNPVTVPFDSTATDQAEKVPPNAKSGRPSRSRQAAPEEQDDAPF
jgi:exodeoxyribonuclease VII small subunit